MLRRVNYKKAVFAGVLGAVVWEVVIRLSIFLGLPLFDLVFTLGTLVFGHADLSWRWWPAGMLMHAMVGAVWAIFYAYFFWSAFDCRPLWQGVWFSLLPAALAGLIMIPQMDFMHPLVVAGQWPRNGAFARGVGWGGPAAIIFGHLVYGAVLGGVYTRPVGYPAGRRIALHG